MISNEGPKAPYLFDGVKFKSALQQINDESVFSITQAINHTMCLFICSPLFIIFILHRLSNFRFDILINHGQEYMPRDESITSATMPCAAMPLIRAPIGWQQHSLLVLNVHIVRLPIWIELSSTIALSFWGQQGSLVNKTFFNWVSAPSTERNLSVHPVDTTWVCRYGNIYVQRTSYSLELISRYFFHIDDHR